MSNEIKIIFSDEAGAWNDCHSTYYLRSWMIIGFNDYMNICSRYNFYKSETKLCDSELKIENAGKLLENSDLFESFFSKDFDIKLLITYTILSEFRERKFKNMAYWEKYSGDKNYIPDEKQKVIEAIKYVNFLNIYEMYHINGLLECLDNSVFYRFVVDSPQFVKKDFEAVFNNCCKVNEINGSLNLIELSKNSIGIQIAGVISSVFYRKFHGKQKDVCDRLYRKFSERLISNSKCNTSNGIKKIMWNKDIDKKSKLCNILNI
ncbi:MAG: hypothetical protein JW870_16820 [Candidatus Delongbacteria bacterium]|nr:hypothetical protein [Candidatus Delongbacteria bacterium]